MKNLVLALFIAMSAGSVTAQELLPGSAVPKAVFYKTDGKTFSTDQLSKSRKSLLMFFDATSGHCQKVAAELSKKSKALGHVDIYLITQDEKVSIDYFMSKFAKPLLGLKTVTVLQDNDFVFLPLFHPKQYPALYVYGADRKLVFWSSKDKDLPKILSMIQQ